MNNDDERRHRRRSSFGCHVAVDVAPWTRIVVVVAWPWSSIDVVGSSSVVVSHPFGCHVADSDVAPGNVVREICGRHGGIPTHLRWQQTTGR